MAVEDIAAWHDFCVAVAGAAAVLAGLVFVAVSINLGRILVIPGLPGRAGDSLVLYIGVLIECVVVLIPRQSATALGTELIVCAGLTWVVLNAIVISVFGKPTRQPSSWLAARVLTVQLATISIILSGCSLLGWPAGGLYWLAGGALFAVVAATANAWVLLVEVVRDRRYDPVHEQPDPQSPRRRGARS